MSPVRVPPSQVRIGDLIPVIGLGLAPVAGAPREAGWSAGWSGPVWELPVAGALEPLRQPEALPVEVWR